MFDIKKFITEAYTGNARKIELVGHKLEGAMRTVVASLQNLESIAGHSISMDAHQLQLQANPLNRLIIKLVDRIETGD